MKLYIVVLMVLASLAGTAQGIEYYGVEAIQGTMPDDLKTLTAGCVQDLQNQISPRVAVGNMFITTPAPSGSGRPSSEHNPRGFLYDYSTPANYWHILPLSAGKRSVALGINANKQIVGFTEHTTTTNEELINFFGFLQDKESFLVTKADEKNIILPRPTRIAALWQGQGQPPQLIGPTDSGRESIAFDINDAGIVVGNMQIPIPNLDNSPILPRDFYLSGFAGVKNNTVIQIRHAFRWDGTTLQELKMPAPYNLTTLESSAHAINSTGAIVGYFEIDATLKETPAFGTSPPLSLTRKKIHAFLWEKDTTTDGTTIDLHPADPQYSESEAWDINDSGVIVGYVTDNTNTRHAVVWEKQTDNQYQMTRITPPTAGSLSVSASEAHSINNIGFSTGYINRVIERKDRYGCPLKDDAGNILTDTQKRVFIYDKNNGLQDIHDLLLNQNIALIEAYAINEKNEIGGCGLTGGIKTPVVIRPVTHDLQLSISVTPDPVTVGNQLTFNIPVRNHLDSAKEFQLNAQLQGKFKFIKAHQRITLECADIPDQYLPVICSEWNSRCSVPKCPGGDDFCLTRPPKLLAEIPCTFANNNVNCRLKAFSPDRINHISIVVEPQKAGKLSINAIASAAAETTEREFDPSNNQAYLDTRVEACFIATAAYGSLLAPEVRTLRHFRDTVLAHLPGGSRLIQWYYETSPPLAHFIGQHRWAKWLTQVLLYGVIFMIKFPWLVLSILITRWWLNSQHTNKAVINGYP